MALALYDRVQQTGTANTTVSFTLSGSVTGFQSFAVVGNTNTTYYSAFDASGNWETGLGTYSTTGPTLTRTTIYQSSNSNAAVTFSGTVNVFVTYPSGKSVNLDASGNATGLGTPASFVGTNITGTASGLSIGGNAATVTNTTTTSVSTFYPMFSAANTTSSQGTNTNGSLSYVPSTGVLTATSMVSSSDDRLKTNWSGLDSDFVSRLADVKNGTFERISSGNREVGVSAQSLKKLIPEAVIEGEDGMLAVNYGGAALVAVIELTKEVKALRVEIEELKRSK